ncbi:flagellar basal body-associated FliL family protein [Methylotuvimicrobium alcaliphilum]|uniref:Flagellar protein FliL n=1 Tax=Methylotuvimicrobium alcaliphilum (strain DSM 19304 / NCIMB 14124 / VKM B-2133 / 20Z) TaxID=1091494 RepID=G4T3M9_META2|nr:flagellar basal body-associated FliL family protein [Methylotuvimicrobium alcaliphilum]CCE24835.1 Flagellar basal body-associated protein FliL [Methylotuvimicrobium alcaliphilum 20Z]
MAEKNQTAEGEKKSSKTLIIIILAVLLVLAGAGGAYFFLAGDDSENAADVAESEQKSEAKPEVFYYDFSKPLIVNFPAGSRMRLMQVSISLLVDNQEAIEDLKKHDPMIRNNLLMLISAQSSDELNSREGKETLREAVHAEVSSVLEKMTGKQSLKEVFFTSFVMQ